VTIIDLTGSDNESENWPAGPPEKSPSPEIFKIVRGEYEYDDEQIRKRMIRHIYTTGNTNLPAPALPDSPEASTTEASEDESTSRCKAHQPRPHMPVNEDTSTTSDDSDDDIIEVTSTKRRSNPSKRSLKPADDKVDDEAIAHKRVKVDKDTTLPNSQVNSPPDVGVSGNNPKAQSKRKLRSKFRERSLRDSMNTESGWLVAALQSSKTFCEMSLERTVQFSELIKLENEIAKLVDNISTEDRPQQLRKLIQQLRSVEERRRGLTDRLYRNVISEYGECNHMKDTVQQWILEDSKVSKQIERSS
jgi:hypothetical protein